MSPPRASSADSSQTIPQTVAQMVALVEGFLTQHEQAAVLEDGKVIFARPTAQYSLSPDYGRCTLHLWSEERNLVRSVVSVTARGATLRLATQRMGQTQTKLLELVPTRNQRTPTTFDAARSQYLALLQRALERSSPDWKADGFRSAMDLEKSFGPAYARGSLVRGKQAWAVIGASRQESAATLDGILTLGILWLQACREQSAGRRLYRGLKVVLPRGSATLTLSRLAWLHPEAAQWELWELDQSSEALVQRDPADHGNLNTRLVHHPDEKIAAERFAVAIQQVMELVPAGASGWVEQRLRSSSELAFLLHGLQFARARIRPGPQGFGTTVEVTMGCGALSRPLNAATRQELAAHLRQLFERRRALPARSDFAQRQVYGDARARRIGEVSSRPAHARVPGRFGARDTIANPMQDPLYRAAPERWLESVLRRDLSPLTRSLGPGALPRPRRQTDAFANDPDPDTIGNRLDPPQPSSAEAPELASHVIPKLDPLHVYAQVPAIAGAGDRGMLDLLGVTADGRLAVIELKADDDLHLALQGLDYWIRVRHHHLQTVDPGTGLGEFQRHGYFQGVALSPLPPRLYLVAPALHIHPATETILRYLSPRVEWQLVALDERWRSQIRVVWRKQSGS